jgi:hypothetical protein
MPTDLAKIIAALPAEIVDRLRGVQPRAEWVREAALRLARTQVGFDPLEPVGWATIRRALGAANG